MAKRSLCVGLDETGRGSIAGPIFVGLAVCHIDLQMDLKKIGVKDSKKLTETKRGDVYEILSNNLTSPLTYFATAHREAWHIDAYGIEKSTQDCVRELLIGMVKHFEVNQNNFESSPIEVVYFDQGLKPKTARIFKEIFINSVIVEEPKADVKYPVVSAASVIAKVRRDRIMIQKSFEFPEYGFDKNKGYGTKTHNKTIREIGYVENFHRVSYLKI